MSCKERKDETLREIFQAEAKETAYERIRRRRVEKEISYETLFSQSRLSQYIDSMSGKGRKKYTKMDKKLTALMKPSTKKSFCKGR